MLTILGVGNTFLVDLSPICCGATGLLDMRSSGPISWPPSGVWPDPDDRVLRAKDPLATTSAHYHPPPNYTFVAGQNLYMAGGFLPTADDALYGWVEGEYENYEPNIGDCKYGVCGHFTQVMWGNSQYLGCAMARIKAGTCASCTKGTSCLDGLYDSGYGYIMVCDYRSPGNCNGHRWGIRGA